MPPSAEVVAEGAVDVCGIADGRGNPNTDYVPELMDSIEKCICDDCWITMSDNENRMGAGGYISYCNLNVCGADGTRWEPSGGFQIVDDDASTTTAPEHFQTLKQISETLGVSPEVMVAVLVLGFVLVVYYFVAHVMAVRF